MATKYESYETNDDSDLVVEGNNWRGQTFTPQTEHVLSAVWIYAFKQDDSSGLTATIEVYACDGSHLPTGDSLASGTFDPNDLESTKDWLEVTLTGSPVLEVDTEYCWYLKCSAADATNAPTLRADINGTVYTRGTLIYTNTGAAPWATADYDALFQEWGDTSDTPTVTTQAVSNIVTTTATGNGNITDLGGTNPTAHGVCYNTTGAPTTGDTATDEGAATATGAFTSSMTSLTSGTLYYVKAYATNAGGTSYGQEVTFTAGASGGELRGLYAVVEERFHYVDAYGVERYVQGTVVP